MYVVHDHVDAARVVAHTVLGERGRVAGVVGLDCAEWRAPVSWGHIAIVTLLQS